MTYSQMIYSQKVTQGFGPIMIFVRKHLFYIVWLICAVAITFYYAHNTVYQVLIKYHTVKPPETTFPIQGFTEEDERNSDPSTSLSVIHRPDIMNEYTNYWRWDTMTAKNAINTNVTKVILIYDKYWMSSGFQINVQNFFDDCAVNTCKIVDDHNFKAMDEYDAIIFHGETWQAKKYGFPTKRNPQQKYIFFSYESPYHTYYNETFYKNHSYLYNWTMTVRRDSDIHMPYGAVKKVKTNYTLPKPEDLKNKTIMAAWLVSNNFTEGTVRRKDYVKELQKYIQVDVYGWAGTKKCNDCYKLFEEKYFFYLSFENSMCKDYVTEKMFNPLRYNVVPIVLGYSNYENIAPPHSIINTNDFPTPKLLADYLKRLTQNLDLYIDYFRWKTDYVSLPPKQYGFCQLCIKLHEPITYSSYEDIKTWYFGFNKCYR